MFHRLILKISILAMLFSSMLHGQNYQGKAVFYNTLIGAVTGGIGAAINKKYGQKWFKAFEKGFIVGTGGGAIVYIGKRTNYWIGKNNELGYAWLSRFVFSAGNSIVENAASNIDVWKRWHFDIGFVRMEFKTGTFSFTPMLMPSALGGVVFLVANNGKLNIKQTFQSGTLTFTSSTIKYANQFDASTTGNSILHVKDLTGQPFYLIYGHEMVHVFQFEEFSGINYFFTPLTNKWKSKSPLYTKLSRWIYMDLNYEMMLGNYFIVQGSFKGNYFHNFLENEAEFLSTGFPALH